jgi:hypothetical protein
MRSASVLILLSLSLHVASARAADILLAAGVTVEPGQSAVVAMSLSAAAPLGGVFVTLSSSDPSKATVSPQSLYVPAGATNPLAQARVTGVAFGTTVIGATAPGYTAATQTVRVAALLFGPSSQGIMRGTTQNVMLTLASPTPAAIAISVVSDNPAVAAVPPYVTIPANANAAIVPITGVNAGSAVIRAGALPEIFEHIVNVTVVAPAAITLSGAGTVPVLQSAPLVIALGAPAPAGGAVVTLSIDNPVNVAVSPTSLYIPAGATTPAVQPQVTGLEIGSAVVSAAASGYVTATRTVFVTATITMYPQPLYIPTGGMRLLSMVLSAAAPSPGPITGDRGSNGWVSGLEVQLNSSDPRVAAVQPSVLFYPDGSQITTVVVQVSGLSPGTATIRAASPPYIPETSVTVFVTSSGAGVATSISAAGGTPQSAIANTPFGAPLSALVRDASGNPVTGVIVTFTAPSAGPTATFAGGINTAVTNASGIATSPTLTAGIATGTYAITASVPGVAAPALFTLTNTPAASGAIVLSGDLSIGTSLTASLTLSLTTPAPAGGVTVTLASSDSSKVQVTPAVVLIPPGSTVPAAQPQIFGVNFGSAVITASSPTYASASQLVRVGATLTFMPPALTINGFVQQSITLMLSSPAPSTGLTVSLASSNPAVATVPASVTFSPNSTAVAVTITGVASGTAAITANAAVPNVPATNAAISVSGGAGITLASGVTVAPGQSAGLALSLASAAPPGGVFINLFSSDPGKVSVRPSSLFVTSGMTAPSSPPQVTGVDYGTATITATAQGYTPGTQTVRVAATLFGPAGETIQKGVTMNVTLTIASPTPAPIAIALTSDNPAVASVPASATIPANGTTVVVPITGQNAGSTVIRASAPPNILEHAVQVSVVAPAVITLSSSGSVPVSQSAAFPVTLGAPAGPGGVVVTLASDNPFSVSVAPTSVFVPPGATAPSAQPQITGANIGSATITASAPGYLNASRHVLVTATITMSPQTLYITPGGMRLLSMILSAAAPSIDAPISGDRGKNGWVNGLEVQLTSSDPRIATLQPSVLFYPDGSQITTVVVVVSGLAPGTAVIRAVSPPYIPEAIATVIVQ